MRGAALLLTAARRRRVYVPAATHNATFTTLLPTHLQHALQLRAQDQAGVAQQLFAPTPIPALHAFQADPGVAVDARTARRQPRYAHVAVVGGVGGRGGEEEARVVGHLTAAARFFFLFGACVCHAGTGVACDADPPPSAVALTRGAGPRALTTPGGRRWKFLEGGWGRWVESVSAEKKIKKKGRRAVPSHL